MKLILLIFLCVPCFAGDVVRLQYKRVEHGAAITGHGTAFAITARQLLTAAHNVLDEKGKPYKCVLLEVGEEWRKVRVLFWSEKYDLALLETSAEIELSPWALGPDAAAGAAVELRGSKRGEELSTHAGSVCERHADGTIRDRLRIAFDHGDSGGPVIRAGQAIGLAVAGVPKNGDLDKTQGLFVPASILKEFLESAGKE